MSKHRYTVQVAVLMILLAHGCGKKKPEETNVSSVQPVFTEREGAGFELHAAAVSSTGNHVVTVAANATAKVWNIKSGALIGVFKLPGISTISFGPGGELGRGMSSLAISPDGQQVLVCPTTDNDASDPMIKPVIIDSSTGKQRLILDGHRDIIFASAFSPDSTMSLTGGLDGTAKLWSTTDGKLIHTFMNLPQEGVSAIQGLAFSPDGKSLLIADQSAVRIWDAKTFKLVRKLDVFSVGAVSFDETGRRFVVGSLYGERPKVWDAQKGELLQDFSNLGSVSMHMTTSVSISHDGNFVVAGYDSGTAKMLSVASGKAVHELAASQIPVVAVATRAGPKQLLMVTVDGTIRLWSAEEGASLATMVSWGDSEEWCCWTSSGYFIGTPAVCEHLRWKLGDDLLPHDAYAEQFRSPKLVARFLAGELQQANMQNSERPSKP